MRATLAGLAVLAYGCSALKTYYREHSARPNTRAVEKGQTFRNVPPVERTANSANTNGPMVSQPAKAAAESSRAAVRAAGTVLPQPQPAPAPPILSSTAKADQEPDRQRAAEMIAGLNSAMRKIDQQTLGADGQSRKELGEKFLQSAQEALAEGSYAEAASLADKASLIIAPLSATPIATTP